MLKQNLTWRGTQVTGLGVMIGRCSPDTQHRRPDRHPANIGSSFFQVHEWRVKNYTNQKRKNKFIDEGRQPTCTTLLFYQQPYTKRIQEKNYIMQECSSFKITSQRFADQVKTIIKKGWFSELEIIEIYQKLNNQQGSNTVPETSNINKQKQPQQNEPPTSANRNTTQPNDAQPKIQNKHYHKNKR